MLDRLLRTCKHPNKIIISSAYEAEITNKIRNFRYAIILSKTTPPRAPDVVIGDWACTMCLQTPFIQQEKAPWPDTNPPQDESPTSAAEWDIRKVKFILFNQLKYELGFDKLESVKYPPLFRV